MAETDRAHLVTVLSHTWSLYCHTPGHFIITHLDILLYKVYCHTPGHFIVTHLTTSLSHTWSFYCRTPGHFIAGVSYSLYCPVRCTHRCCAGRYVVLTTAVLAGTLFSQLLYWPVRCSHNCCTGRYAVLTTAVLTGTLFSQLLYWPIRCTHNCCTGRYDVLTVAGVAGDVGHLVQSGSWWRGAGLHQTAGVGCGVGTRLDVQH